MFGVSTATFALLAVVAAAALRLSQTFPPLRTKQLQLTLTSVLLAWMWHLGWTIAFESLPFRGPLLGNTLMCNLSLIVLPSFGLGGWLGVSIARLWIIHDVFNRQRLPRSRLFYMAPSLGVWALLAIVVISHDWLLSPTGPHTIYNPATGVCDGTETGWAGSVGIQLLGSLISLTQVVAVGALAYAVRSVRDEYNESAYIRYMLVVFYTTLGVYGVLFTLHSYLPNLARPFLLVLPVLVTLAELIPHLGPTLAKWLHHDADYLARWEAGLTEVDIRIGHLEDILARPHLAGELEKHAEKSAASENVAFLRALHQRGAIEGEGPLVQHARQVLKRFVREGAEEQVNLSSQVRQELLASSEDDLARPDVFDRAKLAVADLVQLNGLVVSFEGSMEFREFVREAAEKQRQAAILEAAGLA